MNNPEFIIVNLLPYREKIKSNKIRQLSILMLFFAILAIGLIASINGVISIKESAQAERNSFIEQENKKLDKQIEEIKDVREKIKDTLEKRQVVENLQTNRSDGVNILNEISKQLPEGVVLKSVKQVNEKITLIGLTLSNAKVSNYMSNLDSTEVFEKPELIEIKSVQSAQGKKSLTALEARSSEFTIVVQMERKVKLENLDSEMDEELSPKNKNEKAKKTK